MSRERKPLRVDVIRSTEEIDFDAWARQYVRAVRAAYRQEQADAVRAAPRREDEAAA